jgi:hypothetical protein
MSTPGDLSMLEVRQTEDDFNQCIPWPLTPTKCT